MSVQVGTDVKSVIALRVPNRNITSCTSQTQTALRQQYQLRSLLLILALGDGIPFCWNFCGIRAEMLVSR
jgi:hypothetical protein